jgi:O-antigen/teichoic acid export membrane protein
VVRYGHLCLHDGRRGEFKVLVRFTALLDVGSALVGATLAAALASTAATMLGWPGEAVPLAMLYSVVILFAIKSTPAGVLQLFDRFDLLAVHETVSPAVRLVGAVIAYAAGAGLTGFVLVWLASGIVEGLVLWSLGLRELARQGFLAGLVGWPHGAAGMHRGLWRFVWSLNIDASLTQVTSRIAPLAVGWALGPAPAGLFHVANRLATTLAQAGKLLRQTSYPELARLVAEDELKAVKRVILRAGLLAAAGGVPVLLVLVAFGRPILGLIGGPEFTAAYTVLALLATARVIHLFGFPLGATLVALGRPGLAVRVNLAMAVLFVPVLLGLLEWLGLIGAGLNAIAFATMTVSLMAALVLSLLSRRGRAKLRRGAAPASAGGTTPDQPAAEAEAVGAAVSAGAGPAPQNRARNG